MSSRLTITFLGGTGTVTGSKYLLDTGHSKILVDCGLFQGRKNLRERNWRSLPVASNDLDAVILTHAHLDHSGYLPVLVRDGFRGPVFCSSATEALLQILLPDAGHLQEEDARYANRKRFSKHHPALPLYTQAEASVSLSNLTSVEFDSIILIANDCKATFRRAGHILGAGTVELSIGDLRITFSGDLGRPDDVIMNPPAPVSETDYLIMESTYGNRRHSTTPPLAEMQRVAARTLARGGILLIPAFAVGRAQAVLHLLAQLKASGDIPDVPVFLNSPMAVNATDLFCAHPHDHRLTPTQCHAMCDVAKYVNSVEDSKSLNKRNGPMIVISASGMATGGRVLHHLKSWLPDPRNTILFTGFQAAGTRGNALVSGKKSVKIHGEYHNVGAEIAEISSLSAHADYPELLDWVNPLTSHPPRKLFVTHGEEVASIALKDRLCAEASFNTVVPVDGSTVVLS